jgi:hypothetical protein
VFDEDVLKDDVHTDMKIIMMCLLKMLLKDDVHTNMKMTWLQQLNNKYL